MKNQDLTPSTVDVTSTPWPGLAEGAQKPGLVDVSPLTGSTTRPGNVVADVQPMPGLVVHAPGKLRLTPQLAVDLEDDTPGEPRRTPRALVESAHNASPPPVLKFLRGLTPFWHDRLIEGGLILSMALYYLVGNTNLGAGNFLHLPPYLYSFPFLVLFALLSWYRLPFAVALLPLALPYYLLQKTIFSYSSHHYNFSLIEISLYTCVLVAVGQWLVQGERWRYRLGWPELRDRLGFFLIPIALFFLAALISVALAVDHQTALRALREEVVGPLVYVLLALCCLRTSQDLRRLFGAFLGCALVIALVGLVQYFFFAAQLQPPLGDGRAHAMYGSANSIGLFFDYALPIGLALFIFQVGRALRTQSGWWLSFVLLLGFVPLISVLYFSQSLGSALALPVALLFLLALSLRQRKILLIGAVVLVGLLVVGGVALRHPLLHFLTTWHDNSKGISTVTKRLYLWLSAWHMIQAHPLFGVGMDNWLCHYSLNTVCQTTLPHYWVTVIPGTNIPTGLHSEPNLSHPHDIFLHVWVSIGIFGLLAFVAILAVFFWLFTRVVRTIRHNANAEIRELEWMVLGVGGAMLAALCQGLIDSSFLEQDLAFCFWMIVVSLLLLRVHSGTTWSRKLP